MTEPLDILIKYTRVLRYYKENPLIEPSWNLSLDDKRYFPVHSKVLRKIQDKRNVLQTEREIIFGEMDKIQSQIDVLEKSMVQLNDKLEINFAKDSKLHGTQNYVQQLLKEEDKETKK